MVCILRCGGFWKIVSLVSSAVLNVCTSIYPLDRLTKGAFINPVGVQAGPSESILWMSSLAVTSRPKSIQDKIRWGSMDERHTRRMVFLGFKTKTWILQSVSWMF